MLDLLQTLKSDILCLEFNFHEGFGRPALYEHSQMLVVISRLVSYIFSQYNALYICFTDYLLIIDGHFNFPQEYHYGIIDAAKHQ